MNAPVNSDLSPEDQVYYLLAYYTARDVPDTRLMSIFRCSAENMAEARADERYLHFYAEELAAIANTAATLDDTWDKVERTALGQLDESLAHRGVTDPRVLLGIAVKANTAQRRAGQLARTNAKHGPAIIDVNAQTSGTRVVRLRAGFVQRVSKDGGTERILTREAEIVTNDTGNLVEVVTPAAMKSIMRRHLGVDTTDMKVIVHGGADGEVSLDFGNIEDFDNGA